MTLPIPDLCALLSMVPLFAVGIYASESLVAKHDAIRRRAQRRETTETLTRRS